MFSINENKDNINFAAIYALINFTYKYLLCKLRTIFSHLPNPDRVAAPIAGFVAGLWFGLDSSKGRKHFIVCFLISRLADMLLNIWVQNAYTSSENEERNASGIDGNLKHAIVLVSF